MPFIVQPIYQINSIYRPVFYRASIANTNLAYATVEVVLNGNTIANKLQPVARINGANSEFDIDISRDLQLALGTRFNDPVFLNTKNSIFPIFANVAFFSENPENTGTVTITVTYYEYDANNLPVVFSLEATQPRTVSIATRQITDDPDLVQYRQDGINIKEILTRRVFGIRLDPINSNATDIKTDQDLFFSFYNDNTINSIEVQPIFNNSFLPPAYADISNLNTLQCTAGVGIKNLENLNYFSGSFSGQNIHLYSVTLGTFDRGVFIPKTETYWFNVVCQKEDSLTVIWMNDLGGGESYTFQAEVVQSLTSKGTFAKRALPLFSGGVVSKFDTSRFKYNNTSSIVQYKCKSQHLNEFEAEYIKSLLLTMECYINIDGLYYQAQIEDATFDVDINNQHYTVLELIITRSIDEYSMIR